MSQLLCSTGALIGRPNARDHRLIKLAKENIVCDGYEFMMYDSWYPKVNEILDFVTALDINIPVFHCEKNVGTYISRAGTGDLEHAIDLFKTNCFMAKEFGSKMMVLHLWSGIESDQNIANNISAYSILSNIATENGITLTVENVVCNHFDPLTHLKSLIDAYPDIKFTFDTKMAHFHRQLQKSCDNSNSWLWEHVAHIHVNDSNSAYMDWGNMRTLHIGCGEIDFDSFFDHVKRVNYQNDFTVESTSFRKDGTLDFDSLNESFQRIKSYLR